MRGAHPRRREDPLSRVSSDAKIPPPCPARSRTANGGVADPYQRRSLRRHPARNECFIAERRAMNWYDPRPAALPRFAPGKRRFSSRTPEHCLRRVETPVIGSRQRLRAPGSSCHPPCRCCLTGATIGACPYARRLSPPRASARTRTLIAIGTAFRARRAKRARGDGLMR